MMIEPQVIQQKTDTAKIGTALWLSFAICFLCNLSAGLISTLMSVYLPVVVRDLSAQDLQLDINKVSAYIQSLYIGGWAVGGFLWGFISDKIGRAKAVSLSVGLFGIFTLFISFATSWEWVVAFRLLSGFAVGGILVVTPMLLYEIWPMKSRAVMIGIDSIGFPIGIFSSGLLNVLVHDWRSAFMIGLLPVALGVLGVFFLQESEHWQSSEKKATGLKSTSSDKKNLLKGSVIFGSMLIGLWGMFSWIPTWVQSLLTGSDGQAERGIAMMLLGAGGLTGGFASGWVSNLVGVRKAMMICFSGCILFSILSFGLNDRFSNIIYAELALLSIFFGISQGLLSIYIPQLFPVHIRGTFTGVCFNVGRIVTAIAIFFVGLLVNFFDGYGNTLLAFAGIFIIGFLTMFLSSNKK